MNASISSFFQNSPALTKLGRLYGSSFQNMPRRDMLMILHAMTSAIYDTYVDGESQALGDYCTDYQHYQFENPDVPSILNELDEEIEDLNEALSLLEVLASAASIGIQEFA